MKTMAKLKNNKKTMPLYKCFRGAKIDFDLLIFLLEILLPHLFLPRTSIEAIEAWLPRCSSILSN